MYEINLPMELSRYLFEKKISQQKAAKKLGVSQQMISQLILGHAKPGLKLADAINAFTKGKVTIKDWI